MKRWNDFMEDESGMGVVEIILIMVVLIAMCIVFKQQITSLVNNIWNSMDAWGATALLPVFQILGTDYVDKRIITRKTDSYFDLFTRMDFVYSNAVATAKVGKGVKSEGEMIISGTKGYVYVPSPWWKTDYFEIRYEDQNRNKRFFYELEGEGFKYELVNFQRAINHGRTINYTSDKVLEEISKVYDDFYGGNGVKRI